MSQLVTLDGVVVDAVPPEWVLVPYGVFTSFVAVDGSVLDWAEHLRRLSFGTRTLWGEYVSAELVQEALAQHLVERSARAPGPATVRITLYPAQLSMATPAAASGCRVLISSRAFDFPVAAQRDFRVGTANFRRDLPEVKSTATLGQIRLRREAQLAGYDDVLFRQGDEVLEGSTWAVVCWLGSEVVTPRQDVLASVSAGSLGRVARSFGREFQVRPVRMAELFDAELVLACSVNNPARSIGSIDGAPVAQDTDLLARIAAAYAELPRTAID